MRQNFVKLAAIAFIGLSGFVATAPAASAESLRFGLNSDGGLDVQLRDNERRDDRRGDRRGRCAPGLAQEKARDFGLRRAQVVDITPRRVIVEGRRRGDIRTMVFANVRGCPVIR